MYIGPEAGAARRRRGAARATGAAGRGGRALVIVYHIMG